MSLSQSQILPFTNPADQKTALLAGSLDMCRTTLAHAIYSASVDQPVAVVAALCDKCSAPVVKNGGPIHSPGKGSRADTRGYSHQPAPPEKKDSTPFFNQCRAMMDRINQV